MKRACFFLGLWVCVLVSCRKSGIANESLAALRVVNVLVDGKTIKLNTNVTDSAPVNNNKVFSVFVGKQTVYLYPTNNYSNPYVNQPFTFNTADIYSLYLGGLPAKPDAVVVKEAYPQYHDSAFGVRFVNLYYNGSPIKVTLSATPGVVEFSNLAYKGVTTFKAYKAGAANSTYVFDIRDAVTDAPLLSYSLLAPRFFNVTLVLKGMVGGTGTNTPGIVRVNDY